MKKTSTFMSHSSIKGVKNSTMGNTVSNHCLCGGRLRVMLCARPWVIFIGVAIDSVG